MTSSTAQPVAGPNGEPALLDSDTRLPFVREHTQLIRWTDPHGRTVWYEE